MPTSVRISTARRCASCLLTFSCAWITSVTCIPIVKTGLSEVIGSWNTMLMSLPRICADLVPRQLQQVAPVVEDLAGDDAAGRIGNEAQDAERGDALAGARFADEAEHFALRAMSRSTPSTALATPDSV